MKASWYSDIHLGACEQSTREDFIRSLISAEPENLIISGDIDIASGVSEALNQISRALPNSKIYFVLGNHDYYGSSLKEVFELVTQTAAKSKNLVFLSASEAIQVSPGVALVGDDGFYDLQSGIVDFRRFTSSDLTHIKDFNIPSIDSVNERIATWVEVRNNTATQKIKEVIKQGAQEIIFVCHYPPYEKCCNQPSNGNGKFSLPYYVNVDLGKSLDQLADANPLVQFSVVCGHTHSRSQYQCRENLFVRVASATTGKPAKELDLDLKLGLIQPSLARLTIPLTP